MSEKVKGIILAGGSGTRMWPMTKAVSKQMLPLFDKPMIYYPLSTLMMAGIKDILLISTPRDLPRFRELFDGSDKWGVNIKYAEQPSPDGLAQAFTIAADSGFSGDNRVAMILGDNVFHGQGLDDMLQNAVLRVDKATVFGYHVKHPQQYGVVEFDGDGEVLSIEEKPEFPKSNYALVGLYFFDNRAGEFARELKPSTRGELEITDLMNDYLSEGMLNVELMDEGMAWLDTGTPGDMKRAANYVEAIQERQGIMVGCPEIVALDNAWIDVEQLKQIVAPFVDNNGIPKNDYYGYLFKRLNE